MVGLRNRSTWEPLLLKASSIKSCANGCSLGITAHLTYANAGVESVEGEMLFSILDIFGYFGDQSDFFTVKLDRWVS